MDLLIRSTRVLVVALALALGGCVPDVDTDESRLGAPRLLAVRAEPAEAAPGGSVALRALYADADGEIADAPIDWAFCLARKPLAELGPVARACLDATGEHIAPIGIGIDATGTVPRDACRLFGPDPPPAEPGQPPGRPVDPDSTGGYRQPLRVIDPAGDVSLAELRIACGVATATQEQSAEFTRRYRRNVTPAIDVLELVRGGATVALGDEPVEVALGETVTLRAAWTACPEGEPAECTGAERYLRFDPTTRALVVERESIRAAWYVSGGTFARERTGVASDDPATATENELVLDALGEVTLVVVLRDARGGASWRTAQLHVVE